ncbi:hypothetical protein RchiOBHm_Chr1g0349051 [Rosa chinensis]|uniref:Reverse transcriptase zinc-binding domain-containing protein n=1 Tax=Rosa chinensis TaxID=74649 RepID=A0A2P6SFQ8_ROSCH|nr:hypothetical protein RchiOBHm_Chr1g0349051 [Rosa chinensis]
MELLKVKIWKVSGRDCRREDGGLGFYLRAFNQAMLAKTVWRIFWGKHSLVIDGGTIWRIGNGKRVIIKGDRWMPCLRTQEPLVRSLFLSHEAEMILSMPMGLHRVPAKLVWHFTKNGTFTVKSGYWVVNCKQGNAPLWPALVLLLRNFGRKYGI